jgi:hypothetical protein
MRHGRAAHIPGFAEVKSVLIKTAHASGPYSRRALDILLRWGTLQVEFDSEKLEGVGKMPGGEPGQPAVHVFAIEFVVRAELLAQGGLFVQQNE